MKCKGKLQPSSFCRQPLWWVVVIFGLLTGRPEVSGQNTAFTYQGQLSVGGVPANGNYDFTFGLYPTNAGGVPAGNLLTNSSIVVSNGLFTTVLDFGPVLNGTPYWLEIGVQPAGGTNGFGILVPRQALNSTPYAAYAANAGTVAGVLAASNLPPSVALLNSSPNFSGTVTAPGFAGDGSGLTNLNTTNLVGTIPTAQLNGTIPLAQLPAAVVTNGAGGVNLTGVFAGDGSGLTNLNTTNLVGTIPVAQLNGTIPLAQLPSVVITNGAGGVNITGVFSGGGGGLTSLNASQLTSGTVADAQLSTNVGLLNANQNFTGSNAFSGVVMATNGNNLLNGTFTGNVIGNGGGLTNLNSTNLVGTIPAAQLNGTIPLAQLPPAVITNGAGGVNLTGGFTGGGGGLTNLNASQLASGTIPDAQLSTNVPLLNGNNNWTGTNNFANGLSSGSNFVSTYNGGNSGWQLMQRAVINGLPVPSFRPTSTGQRLALDGMPNGNPGDGGDGVSWLDWCLEDCEFGNPIVHSIHLSTHPGFMEISSVSYNGGTALPLGLGYGNGSLAGDSFPVIISPSGQVTITNPVIQYNYKPAFYTNYTAGTNDQILFCNGTNQLITLPGGAWVTKIYTIISISTHGSVLVTNASGSITINGGLSQLLGASGSGTNRLTVIYDGANWQ
jgi:hypothetical protein